MKMPFSNHRGKSIEEVLLIDPVCAVDILAKEQPTAEELQVRDEVMRLLDIFDAKPLARRCRYCETPATRSTVYKGLSVGLNYWCDDCDPYLGGASRGKLTVIRTYMDAFLYVIDVPRGKARFAEIIGNLARAKGLPDKATEGDIRKLFKAPKVPRTRVRWPAR